MHIKYSIKFMVMLKLLQEEILAVVIILTLHDHQNCQTQFYLLNLRDCFKVWSSFDCFFYPLLSIVNLLQAED